MTSYTLQNEASIQDLNERLKDPVVPLNFRPNFVMKGPKAFEEDNWEWVKIGEIVFRKAKPCTRCIFTTIDPETGEKHPKYEPLKTLRKSVFLIFIYFFFIDFFFFLISLFLVIVN